MREIKFRAWDKINNEMIFPSDETSFKLTPNGFEVKYFEEQPIEGVTIYQFQQ